MNDMAVEHLCLLCDSGIPWTRSLCDNCISMESVKQRERIRIRSMPPAGPQFCVICGAPMIGAPMTPGSTRSIRCPHLFETWHKEARDSCLAERNREEREPPIAPLVDPPRNAEGDRRIFASGTTSSRVPAFHLIPRRAMLRIAHRFEVGLERYGSRSWNAAALQTALTDRDFIVERVTHVINHAYAFLAKFYGQMPDDGDDDAGAIAWGGVFLAEAMEEKEARERAAKGDE